MIYVNDLKIFISGTKGRFFKESEVMDAIFKLKKISRDLVCYVVS